MNDLISEYQQYEEATIEEAEGGEEVQAEGEAEVEADAE
jgi:hypothetical protein